MHIRLMGVVLVVASVCASTFAASPAIEDMRREVEQLRKELGAKGDKKLETSIDERTAAKYAQPTPVQTKAMKLQISGLVQVWYQSIQNDTVGVNKLTEFTVNGLPGEINEVNDNDSFRIRRTELRFAADITENISAYVMIDPTRESNVQFVGLPTFVVHNAPAGNPIFQQTGAGQQGGNTIIPQLLQDAYINFHGVVPHHDFTIGQFKPPSGEEASRNSGQLDFVERAMVTGLNNVRDIGLMVHGSWWDNRFEYYVGVFNGPSNTVLSNPELVEGGNRTDDNDEKDISWRLSVRPVWNAEKWYGRLELGYSRTDGWRGESAAQTRDSAINGLNISTTDINRQAAWAWYRPGGPVKGWWFRGEWGSSRDRFNEQGISAGPTNWLNIGSGTLSSDGGQLNPRPVTLSGWYFGTGYRMSQSVFAESLKNGGALSRALSNLEFAFRYEVFENTVMEDLVNPDRNSDVFKTQAYTAGINYYIKGYDARIQANYIWVDEPSDGNPDRGLREVRNDVFVVSFQVGF